MSDWAAINMALGGCPRCGAPHPLELSALHGLKIEHIPDAVKTLEKLVRAVKGWHGTDLLYSSDNYCAPIRIPYDAARAALKKVKQS